MAEAATTAELLGLFKAIDTTRTGTVAVADLQAVLCDPKVPLALQPEEVCPPQPAPSRGSGDTSLRGGPLFGA